MKKKQKRSIWPEVATILLIISLVANVVFAVLYVQLSESTKRTVEQLEMRVEEFSSLMQERQDSLNNEEETFEGKDPEKETSSEKDNKMKEETEESNLKKKSEKDSAESETETEQETGIPEELIEDLDNPITEIAEQYLFSRETNGEKWSVCVENLENNEINGYNSSEKMQSASVIKVFIMGAVYDRMCYPSSPERLIAANESYDGELRYLLEQMITVSDNDAANQLITKLGEVDFSEGAKVVNQFCRENGYTSTSVGRKFLEQNPTGDNYTSAEDCTKILSDIYHGTCVEKEASEKMLTILKQQTNTTKIPAGLPSGVSTANKTGEMPEGYGLGCIENDMAIVFTDQGDYVITVLSNELGGRNEEAKQVIQQISRAVYEVMNDQDGIIF